MDVLPHRAELTVHFADKTLVSVRQWCDGSIRLVVDMVNGTHVEVNLPPLDAILLGRTLLSMTQLGPKHRVEHW
ncbi:MAG TPA: hypothetical protein VGK73_13110 [Polyangiaceae bacterium]